MSKILFLRQIEQDNQEKVLEVLLQLYFKNTPLSLETMTLQAQEGRFVEVAQEAHKLKSSCGNLGLISLAEIFARIERQLKSGISENVSADLALAICHFEDSKQVLHDVLK
ncbi:MAG: Hpt domain-containing protein [Bdellovibrio sp.]